MDESPVQQLFSSSRAAKALATVFRSVTRTSKMFQPQPSFVFGNSAAPKTTLGKTQPNTIYRAAVVARLPLHTEHPCRNPLLLPRLHLVFPFPHDHPRRNPCFLEHRINRFQLFPEFNPLILFVPLEVRRGQRKRKTVHLKRPLPLFQSPNAQRPDLLNGFISHRVTTDRRTLTMNH